MDLVATLNRPGALLVRRLIILTLAGLLVFYHCLTLYDLYLGDGAGSAWGFDHLQSVIRVAIVASLLLVIVGVRPALWGMWIAIAALVATQFWAHLADLPVDFTAGRHPLSYLKGFIFPTIITLASKAGPGSGGAGSDVRPARSR
jgi:hypothetical protein